MDYTERLRDLRTDNDYTQKEIAAILGVAQTTYSQYENGTRPIRVEYIIALCKLYDVSANYILGMTDKKK